MMLDGDYLSAAVDSISRRELTEVEMLSPNCPHHCRRSSVSHLLLTEYCIKNLLTSVPLSPYSVPLESLLLAYDILVRALCPPSS